MGHRIGLFVLGLVASSCVIAPLDGGKVDARADGTPVPIDVTGYALSANVPVRFEVKNQRTGAWELLGATRSSTTGETLFRWDIKDVLVREPRWVGSSRRGAPGDYFAEVRGRSGADRGPMATYDEEGAACLREKLARGEDWVLAGRDCATGDTVTVYWDEGDVDAQATRQQLTNNTGECVGVPRTVHPLEGEEGHWLATRLSAPRAPFVVTDLRYILAGQPQLGCNGRLQHRVRVFRSSDRRPARAPEYLGEYSVTPRGPGSLGAAFAENIELDPPVILEGGESLFVAIEMPRTGEDSYLCVTACDGASPTERYYWSFATDAPFQWQAFEDFDFASRPLVTAEGYAE